MRGPWTAQLHDRGDWLARLRHTRGVDPNRPLEPSAFGRLLEEISWEGNARKYHDGGIGKENVLTVEVFSALDFLPRAAFLGSAIRHSAGGSDVVTAAIADTVEGASMSILPGDIQPHHVDGTDTPWRVQPDVLIETDTICCVVEAKRIRPSQFQEHQLLRTLYALNTHADGRTPLLLLVTGTPPPFKVQHLGIATIEESLEHSLMSVPDEQEREVMRSLAIGNTAWTTWARISQIAEAGSAGLEPVPDEVASAISRLAASICDAVARHS